MNTIRPFDRRSRGKHRLRHRELADHVDFQLLSPLIGTDGFHGSADNDAGVVHDGVEPLR